MYTKKELIKKMEFRRNFLNIAFLVCAIFFIAFSVAFMSFENTFLVIVLSVVILAITTALSKMLWNKNVKEKWSDEEFCSQVLMTAMNDKFDDVDIAVKESIDEDVIKRSGFKFAEKYDEFVGRNYISAYRNNLHIEFCQAIFGNMRIVYEDTDEHNYGGTHRVRDDIFNGTFYMFNMSGSFYPVTITTAKSHKSDNSLKTGNVVFDKIFSVYSEEPDTVSLTLTGNTCDFLIKAANKTKNNIFISFLSDGNICVAFNEVIYNKQQNNGEKAFAVIENQLEIISELIDGIYGRILL